MSVINNNFLLLERNYLFAEVARRVKEYSVRSSGKSVISLGIGDVTRPLPRCAVNAIEAAAAEMEVLVSFPQTRLYFSTVLSVFPQTILL